MTTRSLLVSLSLPALAACSEFDLGRAGDDVPAGACPLEVPLPIPLAPDETCGVVPEVVDPWNLVEEWSYWGAGPQQEHNASYSPPLVARLVDTDADGDVDGDDHPNIVLVAFPSDLSETREGVLQVLDGVTRQELWRVDGVYYGTGHAIGDVTGDGRADVVVFDAGRRVSLYDGTGTRIWRTAESVEGMYPQATIADLDADGVPEVVADNLILAGPTGDVRGDLVVRTNIPYTMPAIGDVDVDGKQEILYGNTVHAWDGTPLWSTNFAGDYGHFGAIVNADDDPQGELLMVGGYKLVAFEADGTEIYRWDLPRRAASAPCVADFDGDGASEVAFGLTNGNSAFPALFQVRELDGALLWEREVTDASGIAGCSAYDVDGDGAYEIFYADEVEIFVFDGATGTPRFHSLEHYSGTVYEYPVIADVDLDGSAEMLVVRSNTDALPLLSVFGHAGSGWAPAGETWPIHDFAVSNVTPDGGVPQAPPLYWVEHNTYRARPVIDESPVDFQVEVVDVCSASCQDDSEVRVGVQVRNMGTLHVPPGVGVTLWAAGLEGSTAVETQHLGDMQPGRVVNLVFEVPLSAIGDAELLVRIDDVGTGAGVWPECREDNNEDRWGRVDCGAR